MEKLTTSQYKELYERALRKMQSGVHAELEVLGTDTPKHLRVGVNHALVSHAALSGLLMEKGIISENEYWENMACYMLDEVHRYEAILSKATGSNITLGEAGVLSEPGVA